MTREASSLTKVAVVAVGLVASTHLQATGPDRGRSDNRAPEVILEEYEAVSYPLGVESGSAADLLAFEGRMRACARARNRLARELFESHPGHPEVPRVLGSRWHMTCTLFDDPDTVLEEIDALLAGDVSDELRREAIDRRALAAIRSDTTSSAEAERAVEAAADAGSPRTARLLWDLASRRLPTPGGQRRILGRLLREERSSEYAIDAALHYRLLDRVGERVPLAYPDLLTGERMTTESFSGREVVVLVARTRLELDAPIGGPVRELAIWQGTSGGSGRDVLCVWQDVGSDAADCAARVTREIGLSWSVYLDRPGDSDEAWVDALRPAVTPLFLLLDQDGRLKRASLRLATLFEAPSSRSSVPPAER